jgi:hypothetical protein
MEPLCLPHVALGEAEEDRFRVGIDSPHRLERYDDERTKEVWAELNREQAVVTRAFHCSAGRAAHRTLRQRSR